MNSDNSKMYSLDDSNNYKSELLISSDSILKKYINLLNCYIEHYIKSNYTDSFYIKNVQFYYYLLDKGISTINHVFTILLMYTKNVELVEYYCTKVIYYYIEFIGQNSDQNENKIDYSNASRFSYLKTIYNLKKSYKKPINNSLDYEMTELACNNERNEMLMFAFIDKMIISYQIILNRHLIKYNSELTQNKLIVNTNVTDKCLLINYINSNMAKCSNYILNTLYNDQETYIIIVKYLSLGEMYDCKLIDGIASL